MARYRIGGDLEFETVTPGELRDELDMRDKRTEQKMLQAFAGVKPRRLPPMRGAVTAAGIAIGGDTGQPQVGPAAGWFWFLRLISVTGLAFGATPDVLNMQIFGAGAGLNWWQFNGNSFGTGWGLGELWMEPTEYLGFQSQGAVSAPVGTQITVVGSLYQVPAEQVAKLMGR